MTADPSAVGEGLVSLSVGEGLVFLAVGKGLVSLSVGVEPAFLSVGREPAFLSVVGEQPAFLSAGKGDVSLLAAGGRKVAVFPVKMAVQKTRAVVPYVSLPVSAVAAQQQPWLRLERGDHSIMPSESVL